MEVMRSQLPRILRAMLLLCTAFCGNDAADREYLAALRGEEENMTRVEQIAHLDRAIEIGPSRARYWEIRAVYRIDLRQFEAALADLDRAIELAERSYLRFLRGSALCQSGRYAESLADVDAAIAGQPDNAQFYRGRALARVELGMAADALADADQLVALAPQRAESHYARGRSLAALGRDEEALAEYDEAIRQRPELIYSLQARADSLERLGETTRAAADRSAAENAAGERQGCAVCLDPFRY